jgi:hypothetical protein
MRRSSQDGDCGQAPVKAEGPGCCRRLDWERGAKIRRICAPGRNFVGAMSDGKPVSTFPDIALMMQKIRQTDGLTFL